MRAGWRWAVCAAVVAVLVVLPFAVRYAPVTVPEGAPAALLVRMQESWSKPYEGYAESTGSLALPTTDQLDDLSSLLSGRTQVRVWWQSATDWRADTITPAGERSTRMTAAGSLVWDYEDNRVVVAAPEADNPVRLPRDTDTLPPALAARMLSEATPDQVQRAPAPAGRRSAGGGPAAAAERPAQQRRPGRRLGRLGVGDPCPRRGVRPERRRRGDVQHLPRLLGRRPGAGGAGVHRATRGPRALGAARRPHPRHRPLRRPAAARHPARLRPVPPRRGGGDDRRVRPMVSPSWRSARSRNAWRTRCATSCGSRPEPASYRRASPSRSDRSGCC